MEGWTRETITLDLGRRMDNGERLTAQVAALVKDGYAVHERLSFDSSTWRQVVPPSSGSWQITHLGSSHGIVFEMPSEELACRWAEMCHRLAPHIKGLSRAQIDADPELGAPIRRAVRAARSIGYEEAMRWAGRPALDIREADWWRSFAQTTGLGPGDEPTPALVASALAMWSGVQMRAAEKEGRWQVAVGFIDAEICVGRGEADSFEAALSEAIAWHDVALVANGFPWIGEFGRVDGPHR